MATRRSTTYDKERGETSKFPYRLYGGAAERENSLSGMTPEFYEALSKMYAEAPLEVQRELGIVSGFRDRETQQKLWDKSDKTGHTVARPGTSRHEKGTAADLYGFGLKGGESVSEATRKYVHSNAEKYGLAFPMDYEPWHIQMASAEMERQGYTPEQIKAAFLSTVAGTEAPAYNTLYGGGNFGEDYSQHPNRQIPIMSGPNKGDYSTAAGRYQFLNSTWADQQKKLGLKDFSPENQDAAAWNLAQETYSAATKGGDLMEALQSSDPARQNAAAQILSSQWTSMPGGIEMSKKYGTSTFADLYNKNLGASPESPEASTGKPWQGPPAPSTAAADDKKLDWKGFGAAMGKAGAKAFSAEMPAIPALPASPRAALFSGEATSMAGDPAAQEAKRKRLSTLLATLNQSNSYMSKMG